MTVKDLLMSIIRMSASNFGGGGTGRKSRRWRESLSNFLIWV